MVTLPGMTTSKPPSPSSDIHSLLAEFDASGQSAAAFARARGLAVWKLRYALSRRANPRPRSRSKDTPRPVLVPVSLVESEVSSAPAPLELLLAGGHRLRIPADFDPEFLRRVVGALARC